MRKSLLVLSVSLALVPMLGALPSAQALELDWSGQFRSEFNYVKTYTMDGNAAQNGNDAARVTSAGQGGYYIQNAGSNDADWETLFMKLQPKLIVNDNISLKSEWWLGDPVYGMFGNAAPYTADQKQYYSTFSRGSFITAQRFWAEILTDFGTVKVGRAPLNFGLGVVWNAGDGLWDHYESTGDTVALVSKFGAFSFIPSFTNYSTGNTIGGATNCSGGDGLTNPACTANAGSGSVSDYSIQIKYDNLDEDFEAGFNFIRRIAGSGADTGSSVVNNTAAYQWNGTALGINYNTYDIYAKKKLGRLTLAGEAPIESGSVSGVPYSAWALAAEADWRISDPWEFNFKLGHAPGQDNQAGTTPTDYRAFYFNPDYQVGLIMFNYQLANFAGPNTLNNPTVAPQQLRSPYDNPITDANYLAFRPSLHADKWTFHANYVFAEAPVSATAGQYFWNTWSRSQSSAKAVENQNKWLGWEMDYGADFQYDQYFVFGLEAGVWFPGSFYGFSNVLGDDNPTNAVFATVARVGVRF